MPLSLTCKTLDLGSEILVFSQCASQVCLLRSACSVVTCLHLSLVVNFFQSQLNIIVVPQSSNFVPVDFLLKRVAGVSEFFKHHSHKVPELVNGFPSRDVAAPS